MILPAKFHGVWAIRTEFIKVGHIYPSQKDVIDVTKTSAVISLKVVGCARRL